MLSNFFYVKKARFNHVKIKNFENIHREARLILEAHVDLEETRVLPNFDNGVCHIGAHSYIRGGRFILFLQ